MKPPADAHHERRPALIGLAGVVVLAAGSLLWTSFRSSVAIAAAGVLKVAGAILLTSFTSSIIDLAISIGLEDDGMRLAEM